VPLEPIEEWFSEKGWSPFQFQREVWDAYRQGKSGLIHSATGTGKTFAAWMGPVSEALDHYEDGLQVLWITPLKALAGDTVYSLELPLKDLGLAWRVESRTGDTSSAGKPSKPKTVLKL
jgi:ATP-dependent Lhr-like helicase